jgi:hypothetical protein
MSNPAQKFDLSGSVSKGLIIEEVKLKAPEDPDDKKLRLRKEYWTFLVKDLGAYVVSFLFVLIIGIYCLIVVCRYGVSSPEAKVVWPIITTLFGGVLGLIVGRSMK